MKRCAKKIFYILSSGGFLFRVFKEILPYTYYRHYFRALSNYNSQKVFKSFIQ